MKYYFFIYFILILFFSCKDNTKTDKTSIEKSTISSEVIKVQEDVLNNPLQNTDSEKELYKALKKKTPLTNDELFAVLPKDINGNKPIGNYALKVSRQLTSGIYGTIGKHYDFFIQDGVGSLVVVRNFFDSYKIKPTAPPETEFIHSVRDGYKTIAFLQPTIKRNKIGFVYNNRFKISLEGPDSADVLWSYIDFENLKKLDKYE